MKNKIILSVLFCLLSMQGFAQILGTLSVYKCATTALSDATTGGIWTSGSTSVATIGSSSGVVSGVSGGTTIISYVVAGSYTETPVTVTVNPNSITGPKTVYLNAHGTCYITLSDAVTGGVWHSATTNVSVGSSSGIVTPNDADTATIRYTVGSGCATTIIVTVVSLPASSILGLSSPASMCTDSSVTLIDDVTTAGTWSSDSSAATINSTTGVLTGVSYVDASFDITYTLSAPQTNCYAYLPVRVYNSPSPLTGTMTSVCVGSSITFSDTAIHPAGTWASSNPSAGTVAGGVVKGLSAGTTIITYNTGSGIHGAITGNCYATIMVTVGPYVADIAGILSICAGSTTSLTDVTTGGTWSSTNMSVATIGSASGIVTGNAGGTATISYSVSNANGCGAGYVTIVVTVNPLPSAISGTLSVCTGSVTTLSDATTGGTWSNDISGNGTVDGSGNVTGLNPGTVVITYTLGTGCAVTAVVTVNAQPSGINGTLTVCTGSITTLSNATTGGTWSNDMTANGTVDGYGDVTGVNAGTVTITYTLGAGCSATAVVTVNALPGAINGAGSVCQYSMIILTDATTGGTWSNDMTANGTVDGSGNVTGITAGTVGITYTLGTGCSATVVVTVNASPSAINGTLTVCIGSITALSDVTTGGTWSNDMTANGTVDGYGDVTGITGGTVGITYTLSDLCYTSVTVSVNSQSFPIQCAEPMYGFNNVPNASGITVNYYADIAMGATVVTSVSATPLTLNTGYPYFFTAIPISDVNYTYPGFPTGWSVVGFYLYSVSYDGCIWIGGCDHEGERHSGSGYTNAVTSSKETSLLSIIPNPNNGTFTITGTFTNTTSKEASIEVVDMLGKVVYRDVAAIVDGGINKQVTLGDNIANGVYLVRVVNDNVNKMLRCSLNR